MQTDDKQKNIRLGKVIDMSKFDELLRSFDLEYFGNGKHKIEFEKAYKQAKSGDLILLDVRTKEETEQVRFDFAKNIPTHEIPDRLDEIPKDKSIAIFCVSGTRAAIVSVYLQVNGYKDVRIITESHSEIANKFKPGSVLKNL